jgi:essential nuclear protein 1
VCCDISDAIRHSYTTSRVGLVLSRYKSGPLPKPFKIIPFLPAWARILALTHPENWTAQACYAATRIFVSTMKPPQARVFLEGVLLDAMREDIRLAKEGTRQTKNHRKLNVHYYESMKRALYKPAAFFKGIVFPLLHVRTRHVDHCLLFIQCNRLDALCKKQRSLRPC